MVSPATIHSALVFEKLDPKVLKQKLSQWLQQIMGSVLEEVIPIDGKSLRGSYDREKGLKNLHLVTAWAREQRLVLGQVKVEDHSNEITAIPALLELIDIAGAIVTLDAMGTQTEIVGLIHKKKADYVVALKSNHPTLYHQVKDWFETAKTQEFKGIEMSCDSRTEKGHHRVETRKAKAVSVAQFGGLYQQEQSCWTAHYRYRRKSASSLEQNHTRGAVLPKFFTSRC